MSISAHPAPRSAARSVARRTPAAAAKPAPTPGRRTCAASPAPSTTAATSRLPRASDSTSAEVARPHIVRHLGEPIHRPVDGPRRWSAAVRHAAANSSSERWMALTADEHRLTLNDGNDLESTVAIPQPESVAASSRSLLLSFGKFDHQHGGSHYGRSCTRLVHGRGSIHGGRRI